VHAAPEANADRQALTFAINLSLAVGLVMLVLKFGAYLIRLGRRRHSLILTANGKHVLTDVWTSLAVLVGLTLTLVTGWLPFDPICGILMALNILWSGVGLMRSAASGLMDAADPATHRQLVEILERETIRRGLAYHDLRHRNVGDAQWVEVHLVFPAGVSLQEAHRTATEVEQVIESSPLSRVHMTTHLESAADHDELHPERQIAGVETRRFT
jgi:cation diffusion facilitator family transporter